MRIISGLYKGLFIKGFDIDGTRPTMDRVKESMFAMIQTRIQGSSCLDLFAGSGNLGLEALSNGAARCYFVDHNIKAIRTLEENIKNMHIKEETHLLKMSYQQALEQFRIQNIKFDIVLLDPPYDKNLIQDVLSKLTEYDLLNAHAYIVCEYERELVSSDMYTCIKDKKYGSKRIIIYEND